jgi:GLPGLI family protein
MFRMPETSTFTDLNSKMQYEARSFFEKDFLIIDSLKQFKWKLSEESKTIAKHLCKKASTTVTGMQMGFGPPPPNGGGQRRDTAMNKPREVEVIVWYTDDIPAAIGPENYSGLPGAILEINSDNGAAVTTAVEIAGKYPKKELVKPTKGEPMNRAQFQETMKKIVADMQKNGRMPGMRPN